MSIAGVFVVAIVSVFALTPAVRWGALWTGVVDHSDGKRKLHAAPVPLLGGVAVYISIILGVWVSRQFGVAAGDTNAWLVSAGMICIVGWCDDAWKLSPRWKIIGQTLAALPLVATQWQASALSIAGQHVELGWWAAPLLLVWLLACINALNFVDGVDGLATSCGLVAAAFLATIAQSRGDSPTLFAAVAVCGALSGFLVFNLAPAKIFLGDAGSMMIGLSLGVLSLRTFQDQRGAVDPTSMTMLLAIPLLDMGLAVARRTLSGRPFWQADRLHMHHRLLERGCSAHETTSLLAGLCVLAGVGAAAISATGAAALSLLAACGVVVLLVRGKYIGHHEWQLAKRLLARGLVTAAARIGEQSLGCELPSHEEMASTADDEIWERLRRVVESDSLMGLEVVAGRHHETYWTDRCPMPSGIGYGERPWGLQLEFRGADDAWCRMELQFAGQAATRPWQCLEALAALHHFGRYWAEHPERNGAPVVAFPRRAA